MIKTKNQKQNSFSNAKNSSCQMFSQISLNQSVAVIIYMFFCSVTILNGIGRRERLQLYWLAGFLTFLRFHYSTFSDEPNSDRKNNDQSKTKRDNKENNSTEWIFGINIICRGADSDCWAMRSPCDHRTGTGIITGSISISFQWAVMICRTTVDM